MIHFITKTARKFHYAPLNNPLVHSFNKVNNLVQRENSTRLMFFNPWYLKFCIFREVLYC